jgi:tyrosine-protein kinase Etk/Wzc
MTTETLLPQPDHRSEPRSAASLTGGGTENADEISLLDLLIVLANRKKLIFLVTAAFAVAGLVVSLLLPSRYTAIVTLLPPQQASSLSSALASQLGGLSGLGGVASLAGSGLGLKNPNDMFIGMLKSRTVEDAMVQKFHLMDEYNKKYVSTARKAFEDHVTLDGASKDNLIHISVEDRDPRRAAELANGYVDQFRSLSEHLAIGEAAQRRLFFEQQLLQAKDNLANAEEALKRTEQSTGLIQLDSQSRALIESAAAIRAQISEKEVQIQGMQTYATGENAQLQQAEQELNSLRAQLAKLGGSEDSGSAGILVPKGKVPEASLQYIRAYRDLKYNETIFEILARQFEAAKLDEAREGALIQVVDSAVPPDRHSFPKRGLMVIGAAVIGLFFGIFAALLQHGYRRLKSDPETNQKLAQLRESLARRSPEAVA